MYFGTLWKLQKFTVTKKNFVKLTTYLVISLVKMLLSRNFCQKRVTVNFRNFHTVFGKPGNCRVILFFEWFIFRTSLNTLSHLTTSQWFENHVIFVRYSKSCNHLQLMKWSLKFSKDKLIQKSWFKVLWSKYQNTSKYLSLVQTEKKFYKWLFENKVFLRTTSGASLVVKNVVKVVPYWFC